MPTPRKKFKVINHQNFYRLAGTSSKVAAEKIAKHQRKMGNKIRIQTSNRKVFGKKHYIIWKGNEKRKNFRR